ncbi:hypothetical protein [Bacillus sp. NPDC093026]|uniref:hypothetical protein n=1 Tax=Bacillus sp. NPDC093026 TaxID=3363948 RepID=UPI00380D409F
MASEIVVPNEVNKMQKHLEKELFLLSMRHAFIVFYFWLLSFITQPLVIQSPLFVAIIVLFMSHHLLESIVWFYKSRKIRKRQSGDVSKLGHVFIRIVQRGEQLFIICYVMFFIIDLVKGEADVFSLMLSAFLFVVILLQHIQFYYVQIFFKSTSWLKYIPFQQKPRPACIVRERKAMGRS